MSEREGRRHYIADVFIIAGRRYSGVLVGCDARMNLHMRDTVCTSRDGSKFWRISECFIRGNTLKCADAKETAEVLDNLGDLVGRPKDLPSRAALPGEEPEVV